MVRYAQRLLPDARKLAERGHLEKRTSESHEVDRTLGNEYATQAAATLLSALAADPYNALATYSLAALYARTGARRCAMILLVRLDRMRGMRTLAVEVESYFDRLFGRKQPLDEDFRALRTDPAFRTFATAVHNNLPLATMPETLPVEVTLRLPTPGALPAVPDVDDAP